MIRKCANCLFWQANIIPPEVAEGCFPCLNPEIGGDKGGEDGTDCVGFLSPNSAEACVPNHLKSPTMKDPNPSAVDGPVEMFIATYGTPTKRVSGSIVSDLDWLRYCLRSVRKYVTGLQGVTIAHPAHEVEMFKPLIDEFDVRLHAHDEPAGKGFLSHQIQMAHADQIVPSSTKYILHCDADCIYRMPTTVEHYFWNDKPYHIVRSWEDLGADPHHPGKIVSDCIIWREPTDRQLGITTAIYGMCMNTGAFPVGFYPRYRAHIERVQGKQFDAYMLEGQNAHPTNRMDWTSMVGFAYHFMPDRFHFFTVESGVYPEDRKLAFWSHRGIDEEVRGQIEKLISTGAL